ncbi:MAG: RNA polymerase subunit sigma [Candidatus Dormibacteraeota bacterium]|nr:RNA polymerase subunit sigma [Candidatus Dormibacteraeota bacterium]MBV9525346.1 RNA polymerase subunit sigma [Candidatus Dormibacteraeota bacterium]
MAIGEPIYAEHVRQVYRFVYAGTGNRAEAEDLTSQVFAQARSHVRAAPAEVRAQLLASARRLLAERWHGALPSGCAVDVRGLLAGLPSPERQILELRFLHGLSLRAAARALGITTGDTRTLQLRALRNAAELQRQVQPMSG